MSSDSEARRGIQLILAGAHMPDRETTKALIAVLARDHYDVVMDAMAQAKVAWVPTMSIYEASRDVQRARTQPWFKDYLHPVLERFFEPNPSSHGSYFDHWTSTDEAFWKENYRIWMAAVKDFERRGGLIGTGEDAGFIWQVYGFGLLRELELHHGPQPDQRGAGGQPGEPGLGDRGVHHPPRAELLQEPLRHLERATELADVLADEEDVRVAVHLRLQRQPDGLQVSGVATVSNHDRLASST
jgi:hypothetical protein